MDFLILYEHAQRELENSCLLKCELEKRGYKVKIDYYMSLSAIFSKPKVLILPHLYDDFQVNFLVKNRSKRNLAIVDLQYEQVLEGSKENIKHHTPSGQAIYAYHSAWGDMQVKRYLDGGISQKNICKTGNISMDLNYRAFDDLFYTRKQVAKKFNLPLDKKWILFFANFGLCSWSEEKTAEHGEFCGFRQLYLDKRSYMIKNQKETLKLFEQILNKYSNYIVIYRPHPAEQINEITEKLEKGQERFYIIREFSVRQWTRVADIFFTYYSTSLVDVYYSKKFCGIIQPVRVPDNITAEIIEKAKKISSFSELERTLENYKKEEFPVSVRTLQSYYGEWDDGEAYVRVADMCEHALLCEDFQYAYSNSEMSIKDWCKQLVKYSLFSLSKYIPICKIVYLILRTERLYKLMEEEKNELYPTVKLINYHCKRMKKILGKKQRG